VLLSLLRRRGSTLVDARRTWDLERPGPNGATACSNACTTPAWSWELPPAFLPGINLACRTLAARDMPCGKDMARDTDTRLSSGNAPRHGRSHLARPASSIAGQRPPDQTVCRQLLGTLMVLGALLPLHTRRSTAPAEPPSVNPESPNTTHPRRFPPRSPTGVPDRWQKRLSLGPGGCAGTSASTNKPESAQDGPWPIGPDDHHYWKHVTSWRTV